MVLIKCSLLVFATLATLAACGPPKSQDSIFSQVKAVNNVITITTDVVYTPPMMILGKDDGNIVRCPHATPMSCEVYHSGDSAVNAVLVHGEFLFAALKSGVMQRCVWQIKQSCLVFYQAASEMTGLAVTAGYVHVGLRNGTILRCSMNTPHSCRSFADLGQAVTSLAASGSTIYVGSTSDRMYRCDNSGNGCSLVCAGKRAYDVTGIVVIGDIVYGITYLGYILHSTRESDVCEVLSITGNQYGGIAAYNRELYVVRKDEQEIRTNVPGNSESREFAASPGASSISFAYGTHTMQDKYLDESIKCIWRSVFSCPPTVFYYDDLQHRSVLEVFIKDGKLFNSQGTLVDTSEADESHSQRAAIFVMGPDGQILVSNVHKRGLLHTSSLLAGNPVSGAGLMQVERGRIVNVTSCSVHYRPDEGLNEQVSEVLRMKGYTDQIDFQPCSYNGMLCPQDGTSNFTR